MKKLMKNKKGFTIVELVIVIAVIAILAAVLIPTFSGVIKTANDSARLQIAASAYKEAVALALADGTITAGETQESNGITFTFATADSTAATATCSDLTGGATKLNGYDIEVKADGTITVKETAQSGNSNG